MAAISISMVKRRIGGLVRRLHGDTNGNVLLLMGVCAPVLVFATGFGIDYSRAENAQTQLNAIADAAALAAVDPTMIYQTDSAASAAATAMFNSQAANVAGITNLQMVPQIQDAGASAAGYLRTVTVGYTAQSTNLFGNILGLSSLLISGQSVAAAAQAPNINFYLVMDKSPSMLLPTTSTGITETQNANPDSCAFACHQQNPIPSLTNHLPAGGYIQDVNGKTVFIDQNFYTANSTGKGVYYLIDSKSKIYNSSGVLMGNQVTVNSASPTNALSYNFSNTTHYISGYYADGYWLTHNYTSIYPSGSPIDLRVNDETAAAQALIPYATQEEGINLASYQIQFFTYDWTHSGSQSPVTQYGSMADVNTLSSASVPNIDSSEDWWYSNNNPTNSLNNNDQGSETYNMLNSMFGVMATPGTGASTSTPQEVLLLITDGVSDESINGSRTSREFNSTDLAECTAIKKKGIKIAILYTYYDPAVIDNDPSGWSQTHTEPYLPNVLPALQSCSSTATNGSPLVYTVQSGQSISAALQSLFQLTIQDAHLIS